MRTIEAKKELVAYCGLYCGSCKAYLKEKCPGCAKNEKAAWCKIRSCNMQNGTAACAECKTTSAAECKDYNTVFGKVIEFFTGTDRKKCLAMIDSDGIEKFAEYMAEKKIMSIKK